MQTEKEITSRNHLTQAHRIVIKLGSTSIVNENGQFNTMFITSLARQIKDLTSQGKQVILVSSGAIGLGNAHLQWNNRDDILLNQCAAAVGQNILMSSYLQCFKEHGLVASQVLLTHNDLKNPEGIKLLLKKHMNLGIIAVINENDSVSTEEITFGDNDLLSARVANIVDADLLVLLSDVNGLYSDVESKKVVGFVGTINSETEKYVNGDGSALGKGGMKSKLMAAQMAGKSNTKTIIAAAHKDNVLHKILSGEGIGTLFDVADGQTGLNKYRSDEQ